MYGCPQEFVKVPFSGGFQSLAFQGKGSHRARGLPFAKRQTSRVSPGKENQSDYVSQRQRLLQGLRNIIGYFRGAGRGHPGVRDLEAGVRPGFC